MTDQEKFEQWADDYAVDWEPLPVESRHQDCKAAYLAAKQDSAAEISELKAEIEGYNLNYKDVCIDNLKLRDVIRQAVISLEHANDNGYITDTIWAGATETLFDYLGEALSSTPAQSLQDHDDAVIERCAVVCDLALNKSSPNYNLGKAFGNLLRVLKGKQK